MLSPPGMQDALDVPAFSGSEEAQIAEGLIDAYRTGDAEAVRQFVASHPIFLELDNQVCSAPSSMLRRSGKVDGGLDLSGVCSTALLHVDELQEPPADMLCTMQVVRLARKLPQGDVRVLAAALGTHQLSVGGGADEEDLT